MKRGKFIVFEGLDGAGTTTQAEFLIDYLKSQGYKIFITAEPTDSIIGGIIRSQLKKHWKTSPDCLQLLFAADRAAHLKIEIIPALEKGDVVLCDRYVLSSIAFGGLDCDMGWLKKVNSNFPAPDLTLFLDTLPKSCIQRLKKNRYSLELFEEEERLRKVRENYLKAIREYKNLVKIDGNRNLATVFSDVKKAVSKVL